MYIDFHLQITWGIGATMVILFLERADFRIMEAFSYKCALNTVKKKYKNMGKLRYMYNT